MEAMGNANRLKTAAEVAAALGLTKFRVYELTRMGEFDDFVVRIGERQYRFSPDGLASYIAQGGRRKDPTVSA